MRAWILLAVLVVVSGSAIGFELVSRREQTPHVGRPPRQLPNLPIDETLFADSRTEPTFGAGRPLESQLCTQSQFDSPALQHWLVELEEPPRFYDKLWQYSFILQAISERGLMAPNMRGLGFGVGQEPLPAVFAHHGVEIVATDLDLASATKAGWAQSNQHMTSLDVLNRLGIATDAEFHRLVTAENVDMTNIPDTLRDFDFTWSTCALGHLGNLEKGMQFIEDSLKTLKPGGIAVHTTEINLSSNLDTFQTTGTSVYRRRDVEELVRRLTAEGHDVHVNFNIGSGPLDRHIDEPPYTADKHLRLRLGPYAITSIGIVIRKRSATASP